MWAGVAAAVAFGSLGRVNADARVLVGAASVLGPLAAVAASRLLARGSDRAAGALLLVSVLTPTYFAYVVNVPALAKAAVKLVEAEVRAGTIPLPEPTDAVWVRPSVTQALQAAESMGAPPALREGDVVGTFDL